MGTTYMPTVGPRQIINAIEADPDWGHSRQASCVGRGIESGTKDFLGGMVFANEVLAITTAISHGSLTPLKSLVSAGTATDLVGGAAKHVAANRATQKAIKAATEGMVPANVVGRTAARTAKWTAILGVGLSANTGREAYNSCMCQ